MSWSDNVASVLVIIAAVIAVAGGAAGFAILMQIVRQGSWRLAEPSVMQGRWKMIRPWLLVGGVIGQLLGIAIVVLRSIDQAPSAAPKEVIISPPTEIKSRPRDGGQPTE